MSSSSPRVSIGLPVFNGEKYLEEALDSILTQTYEDFELIISDNASTDLTPQICRQYASKDNRIHYYRNKTNIGASRNFNQVFKLSRGEYFKWAAHDDVLAPEYLEKCIEVLDQDQSIVLCHSKTKQIDDDGALLGTYDHRMKIDSSKPHERFGYLISLYHPCIQIFGVIRTSALRMTPLIGEYIGSDRNLLAEISIVGRIYEIPEYLFFQRHHSQAYSSKIFSRHRMNYEEQLAWWTKRGRTPFPYLRRCFEYFKSVSHATLNWSEKGLCYAELFWWLINEGWVIMTDDLGKTLLHRSGVGRKLAFPVKWTLKHIGVKTSSNAYRILNKAAWMNIWHDKLYSRFTILPKGIVGKWKYVPCRNSRLRNGGKEVSSTCL